MMTGVYIGPSVLLKGRRALVQACQLHSSPYAKGGPAWRAQFNDLDLGLEYTHGWRAYPADHFQIESNNNLPFNVGGIA